MSKYQPLIERLTGHAGHEWRASFGEVEDLIGFALPKAARTGRSWWSDPGKPHVRAWRTPGWEVGDVDPAGGFVTFRRPVSEAAMQSPPAEPSAKVQPLPVKIAAEGASFTPRVRRWGLAAAIAAGAAVVTGAAVAIGMARRRPPTQPSA